MESPKSFVSSITPVLNVSSIAASFAWFELFGRQRTFSWNAHGMIGEGSLAGTENEHGPAVFGGVCSNEATVFLCCGAQGSRGTMLPRFEGDDETDGVWMTWWVESPAIVDQLHSIAVDHDCFVSKPPTDESWGIREFHLRHPDGHTFRVSASLTASRS